MEIKSDCHDEQGVRTFYDILYPHFGQNGCDGLTPEGNEIELQCLRKMERMIKGTRCDILEKISELIAETTCTFRGTNEQVEAVRIFAEQVSKAIHPPIKVSCRSCGHLAPKEDIEDLGQCRACDHVEGEKYDECDS